MKTLVQLRTHLRYILDERTETFWSDIELNSVLNFKYQELCTYIEAIRSGYYRKKATLALTTVAGDTLVALPADSNGRIQAVMYNGRPLEQQYDENVFLHSTQQGEPNSFSIRHQSLVISPIPNAPYSLDIYYGFIPPDMVDPTTVGFTTGQDIPDFPAGYEFLIVKGAALDALLKDQVAAGTLRRDYQDGLDRMTLNLSKRLDFKSRRAG